MLRRFRRSLLLAIVLLISAAANAQTVLRLNEIGPKAGPEAAALATFKTSVETATQGKVQIDLHFDAALGDAPHSLEAMMAGELDLFSSDFRSMVPIIIDEVTGLDLPFLVPSNEAAMKYVHSALMAEGFDKVLTARRIRYLTADGVRGPQRMLASTKPLNAVDDLRGLKLAVFPAPTKPGVQLWQWLGVTIVDIAWADVKNAVTQHKIDAVIAPDLPSLIAAQIPSLAPYIGPSHDHPQFWQISIFDGSLQKLDAAQQEALRKAATEAAAIYTKASAEAASAALEKLHPKPVVIDALVARDRLRAVYADLINSGATTPRVRDTATTAITESGGKIALFPVGVGQEFRDCPQCPVMVVVPAGKFLMGSTASEKGRFDNEGPQHEVIVSHPFAIAKFPATMGQLRAWQPGRGPDPVDDDPAVMITWSEINQYAAWLSAKTGRRYHMPTEAEYEYAERAGTTTPYLWGETLGVNNANCFGCGSKFDGRGSSPVGSFAPNKFGLYDMTGNVFEWVADCYFDSMAGAPSDVFVAREAADGKCTQRVLRSSSWFNLPSFLRSAYRFHENPEAKNSRRSVRMVID